MTIGQIGNSTTLCMHCLKMEATCRTVIMLKRGMYAPFSHCNLCAFRWALTGKIGNSPIVGVTNISLHRSLVLRTGNGILYNPEGHFEDLSI